jgi:glycosyltransferase involved in cell wall biosynthesis
VPRTITVGVPVYQGAEHVGAALRSLQEQTFADFDAVISVDAADEESARACEPFLDDERFSLVVQPVRLDWYGNLNWLLRQPMGEFFCYRQHDDTTTPEFFEVLVAAAGERPDAAIVYTDCQWHGGRKDLEAAPSIEGDVLSRLQQHIEQKQPVAVRGLMRRGAVEQAGPIRGDEFRGLSEVYVWLAKLLRWGAFVRIPEPLYHRLDHTGNYHKQWFDWPEERTRGSWTTLYTGLLEATMPVCRTPEERFFFQQLILDRIAVVRPGLSYHYTPTSPHASGALMLECLRRLDAEGKRGLLDVPDELVRGLTTELVRLREDNRRLRRRNRRLREERDSLEASAPGVLERVRRLVRGREVDESRPGATPRGGD